jgi:hypothetical protein
MFGLNKITPTKDYCDTAVFHDTTNIDVNIIYDHPDFLQIYKRSKKKQEQEEQRIEKNRKKPQRTRKNNKRKKWEFLLKFINCLKR